MTDPNIYNDPTFDWTIRSDGAITIYINDGPDQARMIFPDFNGLTILNEVTIMAQAALVIYNEDGYEAAVEAIEAHLEERDLEVTEDDFNRLLDNDS